MSIDQAEHGVRARTRQAILDAAATVWARNFSASFSEIAGQAEVSRSTLHRYFTDRQALIDALLLDSLERFEAMDTALDGASSAMDRLERQMRAGIEIGDRVIFLFGDPNRFDDNPNWPAGEEGHDDLTTTLERAREEGQSLPPSRPCGRSTSSTRCCTPPRRRARRVCRGTLPPTSRCRGSGAASRSSPWPAWPVQVWAGNASRTTFAGGLVWASPSITTVGTVSLPLLTLRT